ncbi:YebC/PmpR family DNA-binding transcriptional regulator [Candidatus Beckwithbacteria bacterium]|nr:YebC/PmpR family DNA-binding transcriptional regulator [Candidatus Beckwithbacteria bacterium]
MSGHSKWSTIKHAKGINDAKRGKIFSRLSKTIAIAVREGGSDSPEFNPKLRLMIEKARAENMPKENIARAIDKGAGRIEGASYEEITYEGFGPGKVAMMVECVTDNKNRTNSEIKSAFEKNEGVFGSVGSTSYFFAKKGIVKIKLPEDKDIEEIQLELIDLGAEDFQNDNQAELTVITEANGTHSVAQNIEKAGYTILDTDVIMVPSSYINLEEKAYERFMHFLEIVDDQDDVQRIFHNAQKN